MLEQKKRQNDLEVSNFEQEEITVEKIGDEYPNEQAIDEDVIKIDRIIDENNVEKGSLVSILLDIHEEYGYLSRKALFQVSKRLNLPLIQVYRVAKFYTRFGIESIEEVSSGDKKLEKAVKQDYLSKFR